MAKEYHSAVKVSFAATQSKLLEDENLITKSMDHFSSLLEKCEPAELTGYNKIPGIGCTDLLTVPE
jgi:hypothetical protein